MRKHRDIFDILNQDYGIMFKFMAGKLGMEPRAFNYVRKRGLTSREVEIVEDALRDVGRKLSNIKIPESSKKKSNKWIRGPR